MGDFYFVAIFVNNGAELDIGVVEHSEDGIGGVCHFAHLC